MYFKRTIKKTYFIEKTWRIVGSPTYRAQIINPEFLRWVQTELVHSLSTHHEIEYEPAHSVSRDDEWLLPFIHDQLHPDNSCPDITPQTTYFFGFENEFDCSEANCILHSHWSFHFRPVQRPGLQTIFDLNDSQLLDSKIEDSLGEFLHSRFPSVHFTRDSLMNHYISPRILQ